jgi:uroporphyrinogen-III synthase
MTVVGVSPYLCVWTVISLRPASQQAAMRRAIQARGATPLALPALRLAAAPDPVVAERALSAAVTCSQLIFTSPAAVHFAQALQPIHAQRAQQMYAVGRGTADALRRLGLQAQHPNDRAMHSDGLLGLPDFARDKRPPVADVGVVTAPGGRGLIVRALRARGAQVRVAEVYQRLPPRLNQRHFGALIASEAPRAVLLTSAEALDNLLAVLPDAARTALLGAVAVASSERLLGLARERGFEHGLNARAPTVDIMLDALEAHARAGA